MGTEIRGRRSEFGEQRASGEEGKTLSDQKSKRPNDLGLVDREPKTLKDENN